MLEGDEAPQRLAYYNMTEYFCQIIYFDKYNLSGIISVVCAESLLQSLLD